MKQSYVTLYEDLLKQALSVPDLVNALARKESSALVELNRWLLETEAVMKKHNIPQCAEIAGLRSKIIGASYVPEKSGMTKRKQQMAAASSVIHEAQGTLLRVLEPVENRLNEARDAVRQLLGIAYQANMIDRTADFNSMIQMLWTTFSAQEQLRGVSARILTLVNPSDALRILAEEIDLVL